jgi:pimeloyl-ACP methyl ester carboxylesterase
VSTRRGRTPRPANPLAHVDARVVVLRAVFRSVGVVAPALAARWGEAIFCRPPYHETRPGELEFLRTGHAFRVPHGERGIAAWTWGERGPLVLLMHGWGSRASRFRFFVPPLVEAGFRVVALDGPGHGQTGGTRASLPEFAAALTAVAHASGEVAGVVGHSLGGAAAIFAMSRGLRPVPMVAIAAPAEPGAFFQRFARHLHLPARVRDRIKDSLETRFALKWSDLDIPAIAARNAAPMLVIHDAGDHDVPLAEGRAIAIASGGELVETHGLGHRAVMRDPEVVRAAVTFLARHSNA